MRKLITKSKIGIFSSRLMILLVSAFILRIILAFNGTLALDQNTFIAWGRQLVLGGFHNFYSGWSDYLPGYLYVLAFLAKVENFVPISTVLLYKLPAIGFDLASGYLVYKIVKPHGETKALIGMSLVLFNPAVLANSTLWGQVDSISFFFPLLAIYLLQDYIFISAISLGIGALVKPQAALSALVILFLLYQRRVPFIKTCLYVLLAGGIFLLGFYPFWNSNNIIAFAMERLNVTLSQYQYGSVNAFNFWGFWGFWQQESVGVLSQKNVGLFLFGIISLIGFFKVPKMKREYFLLFVLFSANFLFFTRMHERHLLPSIMALSVVTPLFPLLFIPFILMSMMYLANMYYSYVWITDSFKEVFPHELIAVFIALNLVSFIFVIFYVRIEEVLKKTLNVLWENFLVNRVVANFWSFYKNEDESLYTGILKRKTYLMLCIVLVFALLTRLIGIGAPPHEYFDEVYHSFTAKVMLHGDPKAWEWWNPNPEGFAYEWTHPPLAKEVMAVSMRIFGEVSWAYRLPQAVLGTLSVLLVFLIATQLFNKEVGLLSAAIFSLDGLPLVMSRIGMNDMYVVFFMLLTLYAFFRNKNFVGGVALGLALTSKWTTFWFVPVLVLAIFLLKRKVKVSYLWYVLLPPLVYVVSYLPQFMSGHDFNIFWGMQKQMWWYHTRLVATHPYTSQWWSWPLMLRPIWLYTSGETKGLVSNIYGTGNPLIFWGGVASAIVSIKYILSEKRKKLLLVLGAYLGMFIPWALSPRIMFFYHYFPAIPFMSILIGFVLYKNKKMIVPFLFASFVLFIYFYPHWAGLSIPIWLDHSYYWLPGWK